MKVGKLTLFIVLVVMFLSFSASIYMQPALTKPVGDSKNSASGRVVWQKYNCQSCHQLYGLGGYLGPDLSNVYSAPGKGEPFIKAMIRSGTTQMPSFDLSEEEQDALLAFLKQTDASGSADPRNFVTLNNGMIEHK